MTHNLNTLEHRLVQQLAEQLAAADQALKIALTAICAAHGLEGLWRVTPDFMALEEVPNEDRTGNSGRSVDGA